ncbi:MAG: ATP-binding protein [Armatimonadetes bacterium]|nr:ATP-binding protein [Armatimonadota bacterium]
MEIVLSSTQQQTIDRLVSLLPDGNIFVLWSPTGLGRSLMLSRLHEQLGGTLITLGTVIEALQHQHPFAIEETLYQMLMEALRNSDVVLIDDLDAIEDVIGGCSMSYPRSKLLDSVLNATCTYAIEAGKKLIFSHKGVAPDPINSRCYYSGFRQFQVEDYQAIMSHYLGNHSAKQLDFPKIHRFAPKLNGHQLKGAGQVLRRRDKLATDEFIDYLLEQRLVSNVALSDVEQIDLRDLKGVSHILTALETHVILPFEQSELSRELDLKPKKGVLLYGPPGTGKTSIGRALAHRLKGKFFLIDGTFISGTQGFYGRIQQIFEAAKDNAPSIIFIDDSDILWESSDGTGLYRYLLTKMDGLESETSGMVCVMMTAMDVGKLPAALIRSGRMELWIEMPMPNDQAREEILEHWMAKLPESLQSVDLRRVVAATEDFTGADLRRLTEDAKNICAYDRASGRQLLPPTEYFLLAAEAVRENQEKREQAEAHIQPSSEARPRYFHYDDSEDEDYPPS